MNVELLHYIHCPYCVRVRLALGHLGVSWKSSVVPYNDEKTPLELTGKKMLPILKMNGTAINESLDIIRAVDKTNALRTELIDTPSFKELDAWASSVGSHVNSLAMPYWVWAPEFNEASRAYFIAKKSVKRGPFEVLRSRRAEFETPVLLELERYQDRLKPFWNSQSMTIQDIVLAAYLWGLFAVPEFRFPQPWHEYLMRIKENCRFQYHADYWRTA